MSPRKLRFSVFVIKTYSGTGKRDFNLGLCFCFFPFLFTAAGAYQRPDIYIFLSFSETVRRKNSH